MIVTEDIIALPRLTQRLLDSLDSFIVIRGSNEEALRRFLSSDEYVQLLKPKPAPLYIHVPKVWGDERQSWELALYKGCRNSMIKSARDRGVIEEFFQDHDSPLSQEQIEAGYINGNLWNLTKPILYVRKDCIHCSHIKPIAIWLNRRQIRIQIFNVTNSDFPSNTPVIRAVPQLLLPEAKNDPVLLDDAAKFLKVIEYHQFADPKELAVINRYVMADLPEVYGKYLDSAKAYYSQLVPEGTADLQKIEERADNEITLWSGGCYDIHEYLRFLKDLSLEFSSWAIKINKWS